MEDKKETNLISNYYYNLGFFERWGMPIIFGTLITVLSIVTILMVKLPAMYNVTAHIAVAALDILSLITGIGLSIYMYPPKYYKEYFKRKKEEIWKEKKYGKN